MAIAHDSGVRVHDRLYIGGEWVEPVGEGTLEVIDATTEAVIGSIPDGNEGDVDRAVRAAVRAFDGWSATPPLERAEWLTRIAEALNERSDEIAELISREVGTALELSKIAQAGFPVVDFLNVAAAAKELSWEDTVGNSVVTREPVGVVGAITPWNYPLHQVAAKAAPALAAGCTIVVKPSEVAPLTIFLLAEIVDELGLPAGVFNVVTGVGPVAGEALVTHPDVDMVSFTGSTRAGRRVSELAGRTVKRVTVELGGKSPSVILPDADLGRAVPASIADGFLNSGQTCSALTRMVVPRERLAEAEALAAEACSQQVLGDPTAEGTTLGPLVSETQLQRVRSYLRKGVEEGAKLVCGGEDLPAGLDSGYFVAPTVFSEVAPDMTIAQEEIFGPVVVLIPYDDEEEAIEIANNSDYGLAAAVWSDDPDRAKRVARRIRAGQISINGGEYNTQAPFGGFKQSGHGREGGRFGLEEFLTAKALQL
jgi:aldehyde dehydrogenase (NAD+)